MNTKRAGNYRTRPVSQPEWEAKHWKPSERRHNERSEVASQLADLPAFTFLTLHTDLDRSPPNRETAQKLFGRPGKLAKILRNMQNATNGEFGEYLIKPEIGQGDTLLHFHVLARVPPVQGRPLQGRLPKPAVEVLEREWGRFGYVVESFGIQTVRSRWRVSGYMCKESKLMEDCFEEWGLKYRFLIASRMRFDPLIMPWREAASPPILHET